MAIVMRDEDKLDREYREYVEERNQAFTQRRTPALQTFLDDFAYRAGIKQDFMDASEHQHACTCQKCLMWWAKMGPDPDDNLFGPFTKEQVETYCKESGIAVWW